MKTTVTCRIQSCVNPVITEGLMCRPCWEESTALTRILVKNKLESMERKREILTGDVRKEGVLFAGFILLLVVAVFGYLYNTGGN